MSYLFLNNDNENDICDSKNLNLSNLILARSVASATDTEIIPCLFPSTLSIWWTQLLHVIPWNRGIFFQSFIPHY